MKQTIGIYDFMNAFDKMGRKEQFSYSGLTALFEYLEDLESYTGQEIELDVIALCCEYEEYASALDMSIEYDEDFETEDEALQWAQDMTTVISHNDGILIKTF